MSAVTTLQMPDFLLCPHDPAKETHFITEDLDLAGGSVYELVGSRADVVGVDL